MPEFYKSSGEHSSLYEAICNIAYYNQEKTGFFSTKAYVKYDDTTNEWKLEMLNVWQRVIRFFHVAHTDTLLSTLKNRASNLTSLERHDLTELEQKFPFSNLAIVKILGSKSSENESKKVASIKNIRVSSSDLDKLLEEAQFSPFILAARDSTGKTIVAIALEHKKDLSFFVKNHREKLIEALKIEYQLNVDGYQLNVDGFSKIAPDRFGYEFARSLVKKSCNYDTLKRLYYSFFTQIGSVQGSEYGWKLIKDILENQNIETVQSFFLMSDLYLFDDQEKNNFLHLIALHSPDWKEMVEHILPQVPTFLEDKNAHGSSAFKMLWEKDSSLDFRKKIVDVALRHNFEDVLQEHIVLKVEEICRNFNHVSNGDDIGHLLAYLKKGIHEEDRKIADVWSNNKAVAVLVRHPAFRKLVEARSKARAEAQPKAQPHKGQHHGQGWKHHGQGWTQHGQGQQQYGQNKNQYGWHSSSNQQSSASSKQPKTESKPDVSPEAASTHKKEARLTAVEHANRGFNFLQELGYVDSENDTVKLASFLRKVMLKNHPDKVTTRNAEDFNKANTLNGFIKNEVYSHYLSEYKEQCKLLEVQKQQANLWKKWGW